MNDNLFIKLHKLASAQDENFITETFVHILQRLIDTEPNAALFILKTIFLGLKPPHHSKMLRKNAT